MQTGSLGLAQELIKDGLVAVCIYPRDHSVELPPRFHKRTPRTSEAGLAECARAKLVKLAELRSDLTSDNTDIEKWIAMISLTVHLAADQESRLSIVAPLA